MTPEQIHNKGVSEVKRIRSEMEKIREQVGFEGDLKAFFEHLRTVEMGELMHPHINEYFQDRMHDRDHLVQRFQEHAEEVRRTIPADWLLEFEVKQGWEPLCAFLDVPVPDTEFPFVNDTEATKGIIQRLIAEGSDAVFGSTSG